MADPFPPPRSSALFTLLPVTPEAEAAVQHPSNRHLVSRLSNSHGLLAWGLDVGPGLTSSSRNCLARLGRSGCDITIPDLHVSKVQCDFQVLPNGMVMLRDLSPRGTTRILETNTSPSKPFESGRQRQILVMDNLNCHIGMGGLLKPVVHFALVWHANTKQRLAGQFGSFCGREDRPELARTLEDLPPTVHPSAMHTRIHTPAHERLQVRYHEGTSIGEGTFGKVSRAVDVDSGSLMAIKRMKVERKQGEEETQWIVRRDATWQAIKREIEHLSSLDHPRIVRYISHSEDLPKTTICLFAELLDGSLQSLINQMEPHTINCCLIHILEALSHLEKKGLVHRDVKPANILYRRTLIPEQLEFQLADFGLSNITSAAVTHCGTELFLAPEIGNRNETQEKADVWSLFVTMVYVVNNNSVKSLCKRAGKEKKLSRQEVIDFFIAAAKDEMFSPLKNMAIPDPKKRASASEMLRILKERRQGGEEEPSQGKERNQMAQHLTRIPSQHTERGRGRQQTLRIQKRGKEKRQPCIQCSFDQKTKSGRPKVCLHV